MSETTNPRRMKYVNIVKTRLVALLFLIIGSSTNYLEKVKENFTFEVDDFDIDWENDDECLGI